MHPSLTTLFKKVKQHSGFLILGGIYLLLSLNYNVASPIFEPPDEATHYRYVKYLLDHKRLPAIIEGPNRAELWGLHQPPLYFISSALLFSPFTFTAPDDFLTRNPHVNLGIARKPGNKNVYLHTLAEAFPYSGLPLLVRAMRLLSTVYGGLTVLVVYLIGLALFPNDKRLALLPPGLLILQPEFVFINAAITNEPLNILLMSLGLWGCVRLIIAGPTTHLSLFLGIVAGLIAITKMTGLALILIIVIAMLIAALRGHSALKLWGLGVMVAGVMALVGGWWYAYNFTLYGDPWQQGMYRDFYGDVQRTITFWDWFNGIRLGEISFWATFGWLNIITPEWVYTFYKGFSRLGLIGVLILGIRLLIHRRQRLDEIPLEPTLTPHLSALLPLLIASPLVSSLILARLIATEGGIQGRQLLPMLPALACLISLGYYHLLSHRWRWFVLAPLGVFMLGITVAIPPAVIQPAYTPPPFLALTDLPAEVTLVNQTYNQDIELVGYYLPQTTIQVGQPTQITLYWRASRPIETDYTIFVHALGRGEKKVGENNTYPASGLRPTSQWPPNKIVQDTHLVAINPLAEAPTLLRLHVGLFNYADPNATPLTVQNKASEPVSNLLAKQVLWPVSPETLLPTACQEYNISFMKNIRLACAYLDEKQTLHLYWVVEGQPEANYTVFIQAWRGDDQIAGFDGPPLGGDFPTSYWRAGQVLADPHPLTGTGLPIAGQYRLLVGLYNPQTGERLAAFEERGKRLPADAVDLGLFELTQE